MKDLKTLISSYWQNIVSVNYIIDPEVLKKHLPYGTEPDYYNGECYISLVAFRYSNTRLNGFAIPFHSDFEEINLRIYIKKRMNNGEFQYGVAFPKLFFPKRSLTLYANIIYKENYSTLKMNSFSENNEDGLLLKYGIKNHVWHNIEILAENGSNEPLAGSPEEYFNKHYIGYSRVNPSLSTEYELIRSEWEIHAIKEWEVRFDFKSLFGADFEFLNNAQPRSILLSKGSDVAIKAPGLIKSIR